MKEYDPKEIESKWQKAWEESGIYTTLDYVEGKENEYVLVEFAYPSGNLHAGHWYAFSITDIYARFRRMSGKNVMFPFGFDAFGLPAENAAIKRKLNPRDWTYDNIVYMRKQLVSMGTMFDWSREVITSDPSYYKWTQWLFLQLFKKGLAYRAKTKVNWCPQDKTVLANEQVVDGKCNRCGAEVEQKEMEQWMLRITDYADRLIDDLEGLDWPEPIKQSQRNWIGRSHGALIKFDDLEVFTTRPDTIFGATFVAVAGKEDKFTGKYVVNPATKEKIPVWEAEYVMEGVGTGAVMGVPAHDQRDFDFAVKNNLSIKEVVIPKTVDKHDPPREDKKTVFRNAVQVIVIDPKTEKVLTLRWKKFPWTTFVTGGIEEGEDEIKAAEREIVEETGYTNLRFVKKLGGPVESHFFANHKDENRKAMFTAFVYELAGEEREELSEEEKSIHDVVWQSWEEIAADKNIKCSEYEIWLDRYFNPPHAFSDMGVLVDSGEFNGLSSEEAGKKITEKFGVPKTTYKLHDWVISRQRYWGCPIPVIHCEKCGVSAVPEKDLPVALPDIDDFLPRDDGKSPLAKAVEWVNVTCPSCGADAQRETDTFDTFVDSSWYFLRYVDPKNEKEFANADMLKKWIPVDFYSGGAEHTTMHLLYSRFFHKALFDAGLVNGNEPFTRRMNRGLILGPDGNKMSKSKGNVIDPDDYVQRLGADTVRTYLAFIGPYNETGSYPWNPDSIVGVRRFLEKVWRLKNKISQNNDLSNPSHQAIKKVGESLQSLKINTGVSALMILVNELDKKEEVSKKEFETLISLLAPFAPHMAEELWSGLGHADSIHTQPWPAYDARNLEGDEVTLAVQINGKVRATLTVRREENEEAVQMAALALPEVLKWLDGRKPKKVIVVPGRVVSIVI